MKKLQLLAVLTLGLGSVAFAGDGGWGSSGGESFRDGHNPWFLQNTPVVKYCVKLDAAGFSADQATAYRLIERALNYWKNEYQTVRDVMKPEFPVELGTQTFVRVECSGDEALVFNLGYGSLDERQRAFLVDPRKYIGIAVRTSYDEVDLRGRGFIFISSDIGANRFDAGTVGAGSPFVEMPWQREGLLYRVLAHELGHVFGLPHVGSSVKSYSSTHNEGAAKSSSLMSEEYPEEIVSRENYADFAGDQEIEPFFMPRTHFLDCDLSENAKRFFAMPAALNCVHVGFELKTAQVDVELSMSSGVAGRRFLLARASWTDWDKQSSKLNMQIAVLVRLTSKQRVFKFEPGQERSSLVGGMIFGLDFPITFTDAQNQPHSVYFRLAPQTYEMIGQIDGKVMLLLNGR